tara:strand:- start:1313 stop:1687 length:375 start_codon:yes stop_codon:yes gene_type:complete
MAHFAKVVNGFVTQVIVAEQDFVDNQEGTWVQTSYNTRYGVHYGQDGDPDGGVALRKNYAGFGMIYDADRDAFYEPKTYPSWSLNETSCCWEAPISKPDDGDRYLWDEDNLKWEKIVIPIVAVP